MPEETVCFFDCLRLCGTDFSLMESMFPGRDRKDLKAKYTKEMKEVSSQNPLLRAVLLASSC
jgi:transcription factor TFIIIB component B''